MCVSADPLPPFLGREITLCEPVELCPFPVPDLCSNARIRGPAYVQAAEWHMSHEPGQLAEESEKEFHFHWRALDCVMNRRVTTTTSKCFSESSG